jgi:23S rRNA U2552 (ribose-2'-O)-methylase RlmE/FtsJ
MNKSALNLLLEKSIMKNALNKALKLLGLKTYLKKAMRHRYHVTNPINNAEKILSSQFLQHIDWKHGDITLEHLQKSRYYNIWKKFPGGHKKYSYFELYDRLFAEFSGKRPKILEIGVYKGASIQAWKQFFGEESVIVGIDINPDCAQFDAIKEGIHVRIGSQSDTQFLKKLSNEFGLFDIIIDDGSHRTDHVIATFNYAFLHCLAEDGIYFIEDLNTSYWTDYRTSKYSAMDMVLSLSEMMHHFYFENRRNSFLLNDYKSHYSALLVNTLVSEIRIFDSAAAIYKKSHYPPLVFHT